MIWRRLDPEKPFDLCGLGRSPTTPNYRRLLDPEARLVGRLRGRSRVL